MRFLHYVITMPAFQADRVGCTIVQFREFVCQSKLKICINAKNVILALDNEMEKIRRDHQNQLPCLSCNKQNIHNKSKNRVKDTIFEQKHIFFSITSKHRLIVRQN